MPLAAAENRYSLSLYGGSITVQLTYQFGFNQTSKSADNFDVTKDAAENIYLLCKGGSITAQLTSCFNSLDSIKQVNLLIILM